MRHPILVLAMALVIPLAVSSAADHASTDHASTTLRVTFWVPAEHQAEFTGVYDQRILPFLLERGFVPSSHPRRAVPEGVFDRLFDVARLEDMEEARRRLVTDAVWGELLHDLGDRFGSVAEDGRIDWDLSLFSTPGGEGVVISDVREVGHWSTYRAEDGLVSGAVFDLLHGRDGSMWFGTLGGMSHFDGQTWTTFTTDDGLAHDGVQAMLQDRHGVYWFGTRGGGVSRYDGQTWKTYATEDGLPHGEIRCALEDRQGNLWFGTRGGGAVRYDGHEWRTYTTQDGLAGNVIYTMTEDRDGNIWFGDFGGGGVSRYDGRVFTTFADPGLHGDAVYAAFSAADGAVWLGAPRSGGASRFDGESWRSFGPADGLAGISATAFAQDRLGDLWIGTGSGISRYDGASWTTFRTDDGLPNDWIWSALYDRDERLWFGTDDGVTRYDEETWRTYAVSPSAGALIGGGTIDQEGRLWFGSIRGILLSFDGRQWTRHNGVEGAPGKTLWYPFVDRDGRLWVQTESGAACFDGDRWQVYGRPEGIESVAAGYNARFAQDGSGDIWFLQGMGVTRFDGETWQTYTTRDGLAYASLFALEVDRQGRVWVGTPRGLSLYDPNEAVDGEVSFTSFGAEDGLAEDFVWTIAEDPSGQVWFGTPSGVSRLAPRSGDERPRFVSYTTRDGLANSSVYSILGTRDGQVWFGTGSGISRFDGQVFQRLTREDGVVGGTVYSMVQDESGDIWIGGRGGPTRFRPPAASPPGIAVDAVTAERRYHGVDELALPAPLRLVTFEYAARNDFKTRAEAMVYRYRLTGHQDEWQTTNARRLEFQNLPLGDYTFEVQAVDRDLVYSELATVHLSVVLPFTQYGLVIALVLAVGTVAFLGVRVTGQRAKLRIANEALTTSNTDLEKSRVAAEAANHAKSLFLANMSHEIRTPMNAILGYAQILQRNTTLERSQKRAVEIIQTSGDHLLKLINSVLDISKIEAGRLELDRADFDLHGLVQTVSMMFELQCREKGLSWGLDCQVTDRRMVLGDESKLRQILINLLGNAIKFTHEGRIGLHVADHGNNRFGFAVSDSGSGMSAEEQKSVFEAFQQGKAGRREGGTGLGLAISQRQLALMDSDLQVESAEGQGSRFFFALDLPASAALTEADAVVDWSHVERLAPGQTLKVLVVDDVAENRDILRHMLADMGAEVRMANDGQQALDVLASWLPDIVFLDIRMPVMDGVEALQRIRQHPDWHGVKVAAISASALEHERQGYLEAGFVDFIDKPFRFERICSCLATLLDVRFDTSKDDLGAQQIEERDDWSAVSLPQELADRLTEAAELYSVTEMDGCFTEMESLGGAAGELATRLRSLRRKHDLDTIANIVQAVQRD
jgi:signal transduction histidine kinase/ligand-binding sensor domain-containing protein/FixJ family two-component response regulator